MTRWKVAAVCAFVLFLLAPGWSAADLQWITGGLPQEGSEKSGSAVVKDAPAPEAAPEPASDQDVIVSHMITSTNIVNDYPVDSVNYFYLGKQNQVCYFAYFLLKPSSRIHTATVECYSPSNNLIAKYDREFRVGFTDRLLTIQNETYQWFLVDMTLGMDHMNSQYGQTDLPRDVGLYTIHLTVDGKLVGITFFYVKDTLTQHPSPVSTLPPAAAPGTGLQMSTPVSKFPIPEGLK
jgi:hypothetical protein